LALWSQLRHFRRSLFGGSVSGRFFRNAAAARNGPDFCAVFSFPNGVLEQPSSDTMDRQ